mmetsp:Transcript_23826/g.51581  ORF Transcript_23826/g.51581 Transcript_23826/m.51581 type:complete len:251 (-) Transcript_23826:145-897(-)
MAAPCFQKTSRKEASFKSGGVVKALHTTASRRPCSSFTLSISLATSSSLDTSIATATPDPFPGRASISSAVLSTVESALSAPRSRSVETPVARDDRPATYTVIPAKPSSSAIPFPIPRDAPVMMATLPVRSGGEYVSAIVEDEAKDMTRELFVEDAVVGWAACCGDTCNIRSTCCDRPASLLDLLVTILLLPIPKECTCCCCRAARRRKIIGNTHIRVPVRGYRLYGRQNKIGLAAGRPLATLWPRSINL